MARRIRPAVVPPVSQWQTIYCSLMLLLLTFMVMLFSHSAIDVTRLSEIGKVVSAAGRVAPPPAADPGEAIEALRAISAALPAGDGLRLARTGEGFKLMIESAVLFRSGDASLGPEAKPVLDGVAGVAGRYRFMIQVEGHTDDRPIENARYPSNWELSTARAVNILRYLNREGGIPAGRLVAVGYAENRPLGDNGTAEGRRQNRRIEILFRPER